MMIPRALDEAMRELKKDKKMIVTMPEQVHTRLKVKSAKSGKSMNLLIVEAIKEIK